jgi:hypothetical protein
MGTASSIAIEREDGTVAQISCHWDGYYSHNGRILLEYYTDASKILQLMEMGDLSSLGPELGEKHAFDWHVKNSAQYQELGHLWCTVYSRDRGDTDSKARIFKNFDDFDCNGDFWEYDYLFRQGEWFTEYKGRWVKLAPRVKHALGEENAK